MKEIERKWLVDKALMPSLTNPEYAFENSVALRMEQYYLNGTNDEWTIRLRKKQEAGHVCNPSSYFLELKNSGLLSRDEIRFEISAMDFYNAIKEVKNCKCIKKTRYCFKYIDHIYEFDVYDDFDFITCEVEFKSEEEALAFKPHDFCIQEVTYDPKYKNVNLAIPVFNDKTKEKN